ncbi:hypothetical protein [Candidatus Palauibacter sp.]
MIKDADLPPPAIDHIDVAPRVDGYVMEIAEDIRPGALGFAQSQGLE